MHYDIQDPATGQPFMTAGAAVPATRGGALHLPFPHIISIHTSLRSILQNDRYDDTGIFDLILINLLLIFIWPV